MQKGNEGVPLESCPYKGLAAFSRDDAEYFFGRENEARLIAATAIASNVTVLYGPSGVGKSSVLNAGVPSALQDIVPGTLFISFVRWDRGFYSKLVSQSRKDAGEAYGKLPSTARSRTRSEKAGSVPTEREWRKAKSTGLMEKLAQQWTKLTTVPIVFIFDQFEQYFLSRMQSGCQDFEVDIARVINRRDLDAHILIGIRQDALYELNHLRARMRQISDNQIGLDYLDRKSAEEAIREPLRKYNKKNANLCLAMGVQDTLIAALLDGEDGVRVGKGVFGHTGIGGAAPQADEAVARFQTPYLQLTLERLWHAERKEGSTTLTLMKYEEFGRAQGIAERHLQEALSHLSKEDRRLCSRFFDRMVTPSGMKVSVSADDLADWAMTRQDNVQRVLRVLDTAESRIIRTDESARRYEIFHDILARPILDWVRDFEAQEDKERELRLAEELRKRQLEEAVKERKRQLDEAEKERKRQLREAEKERRWQEQEAFRQKEQARKYRYVSYWAFCACFLFFTSTVVATLYWWDAQKKESKLQTRLANESIERGDTEYALNYALKALPTPDRWLPAPILPEAVNALERALYQPRGLVLRGHGNRVGRIAFSLDGRYVVTASEDQTARIWNAATGTNLYVLKHRDVVTDAAFGPDGRVATATSSGTIHIWDLAMPPPLAPLPKNEDEASLTIRDATEGRLAVTSVQFDREGERLVAASFDRTARIWDAQTGKKICELRRDESGLTSATFDPSGERLLTTSFSGTAHIWHVGRLRDVNCDPPRTSLPRQEGERLFSGAFDSSGRRIVTASSNGTARIWNIEDGHEIRNLEGHRSRKSDGHPSDVTWAAFDQNGLRVITTSNNGAVLLWDAYTGEMLDVFQGPRSAGRRPRAVFSPDGSRIAASFSNELAFIWDVNSARYPRLLFTQPGHVTAGDVSPDEQLVATVFDTEVSIRDTHTGKEVRRLQTNGMDVGFSPDGQKVVTASGHKGLVWDAKDGERPVLSLGHNSLVLSVAYDRGGGRIVTASQDKTARVWNAKSGEELLQLRHDRAVFSAVFSRDGRRIVTASFDKTARIWDARTGRELKSLPHTAPVLEARYTDSDRKIVTKTIDDKGHVEVNLWDAQHLTKEDLPGGPVISDGDEGCRIEFAGSDAFDTRVAPTDFSVLGSHRITVYENGLMLLSDSSNKLIALLPGHRRPVRWVSITSSGRHLFAAFIDGSAQVWKLLPVDQHALIEYATELAKNMPTSDPSEP